MAPLRSLLVIACALALAPDAARAQSDLGPRLDEHLQRLVPWGFSGSVLVARSGRVVLATGYGLAERTRQVPNTAQTLFPLGEVSQQFTAVALLLLAEEGRLGLDDPLSAHLAGVPADKQAITLRHLWNQQSGLPAEVGAPLAAPESKEEALARILAAPLEAAPGTRFSPSHAGNALLCAVVEKVGGLPFEEFVRARVLEPSGMSASRFVGDVALSAAPLAHGYADDSDQGTPAAWAPSWPLRGLGALVTSVGDLYRWERALAPEGLLSAESLGVLHAPSPDGFAGGMFIARTEAEKRIAQRAGNLSGFQAELRRGLDDPLTWVLLLNEPMPSAVEHVDALLSGRSLPLPPEVGELDPRMAAAAAGTYELPGGGRLRVSFEHGRLSVAAENQGGIEVLAPPSAEDRAWDAEFGARSLALCENLRARDFPAAASQLGRSAQEVDGELGTWWRRLEERLGSASPPKLFATLAREQAVVVRVEFERGTELFWLRWNRRLLRDIRPGPATFLGGRLWPAKQGGLVTYDPGSLAVRPLALLLRADGSVRGLSFPAEAGETSDLGARRLD